MAREASQFLFQSELMKQNAALMQSNILDLRTSFESLLKTGLKNEYEKLQTDLSDRFRFWQAKDEKTESDTKVYEKSTRMKHEELRAKEEELDAYSVSLGDEFEMMEKERELMRRERMAIEETEKLVLIKTKKVLKMQQFLWREKQKLKKRKNKFDQIRTQWAKDFIPEIDLLSADHAMMWAYILSNLPTRGFLEMYGHRMDVAFYEWIATREYAREYVAAHGFLNNIEVPEELYDLNWDAMEESLDEGISDTPQTEENDVADSFVEIEIEGTTYGSKTKMNRIEMIEALVDWSQIEDEGYDVHSFFRPTTDQEKEEL